MILTAKTKVLFTHHILLMLRLITNHVLSLIYLLSYHFHLIKRDPQDYQALVCSSSLRNSNIMTTSTRFVNWNTKQAPHQLDLALFLCLITSESPIKQTSTISICLTQHKLELTSSSSERLKSKAPFLLIHTYSINKWNLTSFVMPVHL